MTNGHDRLTDAVANYLAEAAARVEHERQLVAVVEAAVWACARLEDAVELEQGSGGAGYADVGFGLMREFDNAPPR